MQGWLFVNDKEFWQPAQTEALLTSVPLVCHFWLLILLWVMLTLSQPLSRCTWNSCQLPGKPLDGWDSGWPEAVCDA